jgi:tRNA dimethylallyltransferase
MPPPYCLAICGPTASGKSALSLGLALRLGGEVVNLDSVQVYSGLDIGSAKLTPSERREIPHHCLDIFSPGDTTAGNVANFRRYALAAIRDIHSRGKLPILVGGSGLYFTALLHGIAELPSTTPEIRAEVKSLTLIEQYAELKRCDPETAARLNPQDSQRISRALEVCRMSRGKVSDLLSQHTFSGVDLTALILVVSLPRDELYKRIDQRASNMVKGGLVAETSRVLAEFGDVPALNTIGYRQACDLLKGRISESQLIGEIALHTRRFAKRQMTYWRNEPKKRGWLVAPEQVEPQKAYDSSVIEVTGFDSFSERAKRAMKGFFAYSWDIDELQRRIQGRLAMNLERSEVWFIAGKGVRS